MRSLDLISMFKSRFNLGDRRFELLETEKGAPGESETRGGRAEPDCGRNDKKSIPRKLKDTEKQLMDDLHGDIDPDIILRRFLIGGRKPALIAYVSGMASEEKLGDLILKPLMQSELKDPDAEMAALEAVCIGETEFETDMEKAEQAVISGMTALFIEGERRCAVIETRGFEKRGVGEAENEKTVRGPKEGFTESLRTNITLIRRVIKMPELVAEQRDAGGRNGVKLAVVYLEGYTDPKLIAEVKRRLGRISVNNVTDSGVIEQLIEDSGLSPVPQILATERPDRAVSHIMNGRVCLLIEGSPDALIMPVTLFSLMNSPEDVYMRRPLGTLLRIVRYSGALISILLPGYFLALALYHQGMLSTEVLSTVVASRRMVFEPIGIEILLLLFIFQLIREAGQRIPGNIGQAIGIIGGLIMGQAAVSAHLASSVVLIIVAAAGLGNFCIPDRSLQMSASFFRVAVVIAAWMGGLLAVTSALLLGIFHLADLKSFGVPFLSPAAPRTYSKRPNVLRGRLGSMQADDELNTADDTAKAGRRA